MATNFEPDRPQVAEELAWAVLDGQISTDDFQRLEKLLGADEDARRLYLQCVQLHVDLQQWFHAHPTSAGPKPIAPPIDLPLFGADATAVNPVF